MPVEIPHMIVDPPLPSDPQLRTIANDVISDVRYSLAAVAAEAEGQPVAKGQLDQAYRAFLSRQKPATRQRSRERAQAVMTGPPALRTMHFGRFAAVNPKDYPTIGSDGLVARVGKLSVDPKAVQLSLTKAQLTIAKANDPNPKLVPPIHLVPPKQPPELHFDPDVVKGLAFKKMRLFIRKVRCVEETSGVFEGADEVNMGGNFTTPDGKTTVLVDQFKVSNDFDEGELVDFGFSRVFATWDLATSSSGFPYVYSAIICMAEKDDSGFYQFLKDLWEQVRDKVQSAVKGAVAGAVGGEIGAVLGTIASAAVAAIIVWLIGFTDNPDDIIGWKVLQMPLGASTKSYYDWAQLTTPDGYTDTLHFKDDGYYRVAISWKVFTE